MKTPTLILGLIVTLNLTATHASFFTGQDMMDWINAYRRIEANTMLSNDYQKGGQLEGFVAGVVGAVEDTLICLPSDVTLKQMIGMVDIYVRNNPDKWNWPADKLVVNAISPTYRCKR